MRLIDADKFLAYLIYSGLIDDAKCGDIVKAVEKCEVKAIPLDKVDQILSEISEEIVTTQWKDYEYYCSGLIRAKNIINKELKEQTDE